MRKVPGPHSWMKRSAALVGMILLLRGDFSQAQEAAKPLPPGVLQGSVTLPQLDRAGGSAVKLTLPQADAGEDRTVAVGDPVTLSGRRSAPAGRLGFRWIQVNGPEVKTSIAESDYFTFVPMAEGTYQFMLLVAEGRLSSQPDTVSVTVKGRPEPFLAPAPKS